MNQTEKVDLMSNIANLIIHKTNIGAWAAINEVLNAAKMIINSQLLPEQQYIPDSMLATLKTCDLTVGDIKVFQTRRRDNMLFLQDLVVWLLNKTHNTIESQMLDWEILQLEDEVPAVAHLTEKHIADYKTRKVLRIDTELTLTKDKLEAIYSLIDVADLKPEQTFQVMGSFSHQELSSLGLDLLQHRNEVINYAQSVARNNANATLNEIITSINNKTSSGELLLKPKHLQLILTDRFKLEIAQAMTPAGLRPKPRIPTGLENYVTEGFDSWMACADSQITPCTYKFLQSKFRQSLFRHDICMRSYAKDYVLSRAYKELVFFLTPQNNQHAIHALYNLVDEIILGYQAQGEIMPVSRVCHEITDVLLNHKPQQFKINQSIAMVLAQLDPGYITLACEAKRTVCADKLQNFSLPIATVFNLVGRTSLPQVEDLTNIFTGKKDYSCLSSSIDISFDALNVEELHTILETTTQFKINLNLLMNLYATVPAQAFLNASLQADLSAFQLAAAAIGKCEPHAAKSAFFNGSHLVTSIRNPLLLTEVAGMMTACLDQGFRNYAPNVRTIENSPLASYDSRIILGLAAYVTPVVMVLGISLCLGCRPFTMMKSAVNNWFFGGRKRPAEKIKIEDDCEIEVLLPNLAKS